MATTNEPSFGGGAYAHVRHDIIDLIPAAARSILDVGCSTGATGRELKRRDPSRRLVGVDISEEAVLQAGGVYDLAFVADLDDPLGLSALQDERFDVIIAPDVLEHLRTPERTLAKLAGHLTPDGVIIVSLPNIQHLSAILTIAGGRFPRHGAGLFDETHLRWFTRREAEDLFEQCGLRVKATRRVLRLGLRRSARPLWPVLGLAGDFFAMQLVFQLRPS